MRFLLILFGVVLISACSLSRKAEIYVASMTASFEEVQDWGATSKNERLFFTDLSTNTRSAILFVTGSGCVGLKAHMSGYVRGLGLDYRVFGVEKLGVFPSDIGVNCGYQYYAHSDFQTRYKSNAKALEYILNEGQNRYEQVVIVGVSEGGVIAAKLASEYPDVSKVVIIGSGGLPQIRSLEILVEKYGAPFDTQLLETKVKENPRSHEIVYGQTVEYWASYLYLDAAELIDRAKMPVLVIMGENDRSEPIESLRYLEDRIGKTNMVETWVVPQADHVLSANGKDLKPEIFSAVNEWLRSSQYDRIEIERNSTASALEGEIQR